MDKNNILDKNPETIEHFEALLKQQNTKGSTSLYNDKRTQNSAGRSTNQKLNPQIIISNLAKQMKAIQNSENVKMCKKPPAEMEKYKTSSFLSVNMLQEQKKKHLHPPDPHKFDTQLISNTQLINIVEGAEVLDVNVGMTQEFETTFFNEDNDQDYQEDENHIQQNTSFPILDISLKEPDPIPILSPQTLEHNKNNETLSLSTDSPELQVNTETQINNCTQLLDQCIEIEDIDKIGKIIDNSDCQEIFISPVNHQSYIEEPLSPVFNVKNKKIADIATPGLVYNLEEFENFEKIAMPVIEQTDNQEEAKILINSQIIGKELVLQTCFEDFECKSPVIEICDYPIKVGRDLISNSNKSSSKEAEETAMKLENMNNGSLNECFLKDEILFSSDEEDEYKNQSYKDLPFTCALETSFYEDVVTLDKTMYVGFQTASNKSIQIETESFSKAKNLLDSVEQDLKNEATLTELIELCESNKVNTENVSPSKVAYVEKIISPKISEVHKCNEEVGENIDKVKTESVNNDKPFDISMEVDLIELNCQGNASSSNKKPDFSIPTEEENNNKSNSLINQSASFEGFKTASNKNIHLSEKAIEKSKHILRNLDLDEDLQLKVEIPRKVHEDENNSSRKEDQVSVSSEEHNIDDDVIREFQEEIMHTELEGIIQTVDNNDTQKEKLSDECQIHNKPENVAFKTASNKNIKISDAALAKSRAIFQDIDLNNLSGTNNIVTERTNIPNKDFDILPKNLTFKTAGNKEITISNKAIATASHVFNDFDMNDNITQNKKENKACDLNKPENNVSHRSRNELSEIKAPNIKYTPIKEIPTHSELANDSRALMNSCKFDKAETCVFRTASNKNITVSEEALSESKKIFHDIAIGDGVSDTDILDVEPPFYGFEQNDEFLGQIEDTLEKSQKIFEKLTDTKNEMADVSNQQNKNSSHSRANCLKEDISCSLNLGFKTASNKDVKISERALAKSRKIFQDISGENPFDVHNQVVKNDVDTEIKFDGFQSSSKKPVKSSEATLAKSRKLFKDINDHEPIVARNEFSEKDSCTTFKGFLTASNKQVKISKEALAKSRKMFQDIDQLKDFKEYTPEIMPQFTGFQTANNKKVTISEDALTRSRKLFQDISEIAEISLSKCNKYTGNTCSFKGFQTASNKEVKISHTAFAKGRKIFEDMSDVQCILENKQKTKTLNITDFRFQTSSNKEVKTSAEGLAKTKKLLDEIIDDTTALTNHTNGNTTELNTTTPFVGFQTASRKPVQISEQALAKSRKIFEDMSHENTTDNGSQKTNINLTKSKSFKGFQTASNKEVTISADALAKSRKIFQDIDEDRTTENYEEQHVDKIPNASFIGFQTASNKQVNISEKSLARSRKMFEDLNDKKSFENFSKEENAYVTKSAAFSFLFQTASNKDVKISAEALVKSRRIFQDIDEPKTNTNEFDRITDSNINFKGFQTANNKTVAISEEAIVKSRKLFEDLDLCPEKDKKSCSKKAHMTDAILTSKDEELLAITCKTISAESINSKIKKPKPKIELKVEHKCSENFEDIDTQMLNNFDVSMREVTPKKSKRSGSPILSCPKSKKRKVFQIPYSQKSPKKSPEFQFNPPIHKAENMYNFNTNYKKTKLYNLKDLPRIENATIAEEHIDPYIQEFNLENVLQFKFTGSRNHINDSVLTISDLKELFLNSVNTKLVPGGWLDIQLKLIIWKLISYELKFPKTMHLTCTANNVIEQLKFRYDKELYNAERPALRKIFEKDDTSTKMLILCVAAICPTQDTSQPPELLLTDGWYMIKATIDKMLAKYVGSGKITVGTKLVTHGAELVGSEQAVSPWEDTSSFRLKLFGNSTRRARWNTRLGYHGNGAILSQLSNVALDGGKISKLRVFVTRVYPPLYVDKFEDGSTVTRSERLENLYQIKFENERQAILEKIYEDVEKEVLDQDSQDSEILSESGSKRKNLDSGSQIAKKMKNSTDPAEFRSHLTSTQTALLEDHTSKEREKLMQTIQTRVQEKIATLGVTLTRNVVTLLKVKVAGVTERKDGGVEITRALLSIWRPNEEILEIIKENSWIEILNVVPTAVRYSELQISAGRQSVFSQSKYKESDKIKPFTATLKRTCYLIKDLVINPAMTTDYNEIDTVGIIFEIDPPIANFDANKHQFQNVYLTDLDKNLISVNFWGGLKKFGFENVLDTGQIVACTNLQKRAGNSRKNIPQYRVTEFSYFTKTPKSETARKITEEFNQKLCKIDKKKFYEECVNLKTNYSIKQHISENVTPYRFPNFDIDSSKNKIFIDSPAQNSNMIDDNLNLSGLDFESTFKQDTQDLSPRTLLRKRQVKEKIAKLKRYGEPPPLSPIQMINKSKNAANAYKSPFSKSDVSPSVAICDKILPNRSPSVAIREQNLPNQYPSVAICDKIVPNQSPSVAICNKNLPNQEECAKTKDIEIQCSPVITLNRTYVKRSNPVKLNFSKTENSLNETMDEFAEDFDCSPPLSLD